MGFPMLPVVLSVAGSDPSGGAGIQADLGAIAANGGFAATAITALTVQNTRGVLRCEPVEPGLLAAQIDAVLDDLDVAAVKSGMLATAAAVDVLADRLEQRSGLPYVCDPVLLSTSGHPLLDAPGVERLRERLLPRATLVTPNADEAGRIAGHAVRSPDDAERAGRRWLELGARAVLVTGGHLETSAGTDVLVDGSGVQRFEHALVATSTTHGSGCVLASAIATRLALGCTLSEAVREAKAFVTAAMRHGLPLGAGPGPVDPLHELRGAAALGTAKPEPSA
jgi:hydroxymethylpyrimidine/phosphomethylpyrimidine kinase